VLAHCCSTAQCMNDVAMNFQKPRLPGEPANLCFGSDRLRLVAQHHPLNTSACDPTKHHRYRSAQHLIFVHSLFNAVDLADTSGGRKVAEYSSLKNRAARATRRCCKAHGCGQSAIRG
jgi:hypothetical protein